jgi:hypothetical protein
MSIKKNLSGLDRRMLAVRNRLLAEGHSDAEIDAEIEVVLALKEARLARAEAMKRWSAEVRKALAKSPSATELTALLHTDPLRFHS